MNIKILLDMQKILSDESKALSKRNDLLNNFIKEGKNIYYLALATNKMKIDFSKREAEIEDAKRFAANITNYINEEIQVAEIYFSMIKDDFKKIVIPEYQRNYTWDDKIIKTFYKAIIDNCNGNQNKYNIGSLIIKPESNFAYDEDINIIDGQQRLTTLYGFITIVSYLLLVEESINLKPAPYRQISNFISCSDLNLKLESKLEDSVINNLKKIFDFVKKYNEASNVSDKANLKKTFDKKLLSKKSQRFYSIIKEMQLNNSEFISNILGMLSNITFTAFITYSDKKAFDKFYETNAISKSLSYVDMLRSLIYRNNIYKLTKWHKIYEGFNKNFNGNPDIQFYNFFINGILDTPMKSYDVIEEEIENITNKEQREQVALNIENFITYKNSFWKHIYKHVKDPRLALAFLLFKKIGINRQIENVIVVVSKYQKDFLVAQSEYLLNKIENSIRAHFVYKNNTKLTKPRSNTIDGPLKTETKQRPLNSDDANLFNVFNTLDNYIGPVSQQIEGIEIDNQYLNFILENDDDFEINKLITILIEGVDYDEKMFNEKDGSAYGFEHLIPTSLAKVKEKDVMKAFIDNSVGHNKSLNSFLNLLICENDFNRKILGSKDIIEKFDLIKDNEDKFILSDGTRDILSKIYKILESDSGKIEKTINVVTVISNFRRKQMEEFFK